MYDNILKLYLFVNSGGASWTVFWAIVFGGKSCVQREGKGMNFNTPSRGQDTEDGCSKQTASNRLDPSNLVRQQALGYVEGSK